MNNTSSFTSEEKLSFCAKSIAGASSFAAWQSYAASESEATSQLGVAV